MHQMIELHPRPDALLGLGLPAIPYPVALPTFQAAVANDGELPLSDMLHGLQLRASAPDAKWQALAPAMARLAELLAEDEAAPVATVAGDGWHLELGPLDHGEPALALSRDGALLAAVAARPDGGLRMATWQPLDAGSADLLMASASVAAAAAGDAWTQARAAACADAADSIAAAVTSPAADADAEAVDAENAGPRLSWHPEGLAEAGFDLSASRPPAHVAAELRLRQARADAQR